MTDEIALRLSGRIAPPPRSVRLRHWCHPGRHVGPLGRSSAAAATEGTRDMKTVCPVGTTLYEPDACANGYTLVSGSGVVRLVTMNGEPAHEWRVGGGGRMGFIHKARLQSNGSLMILVGPTQERPGHLEEYDWDGRLTWEYTPEAGDPHHDFWPRCSHHHR